MVSYSQLPSLILCGVCQIRHNCQRNFEKSAIFVTACISRPNSSTFWGSLNQVNYSLLIFLQQPRRNFVRIASFAKFAVFAKFDKFLRPSKLAHIYSLKWFFFTQPWLNVVRISIYAHISTDTQISPNSSKLSTKFRQSVILITACISGQNTPMDKNSY